MAQIEEASPICRGKNLSWDTVLLFYNNMPREALPKTKFHAYTEARINGWTTTHSQIARQLAFYYEENGICYPRFTQEMSYSDLFKYMQNWAAKYFIPNPYAPSLKDYEPTCIYAAILNALESGKKDFDEIIDSIFGITLSSHDKVKVYLSNFTDLLINDAKQVSVNKRTFGIKTDLHPDKLLVTDAKRYFEYFNFDSEIVAKSHRIINEGNSLQQIFYGAPGTGKSHTIQERTEHEDVIRTTFHPDTDYSTFVGAYKPTTIDAPVMTVIGTKAVPVENEDGSPRIEPKIIYEFVNQAFLQAYVKAWEKYCEGGFDNAQKQFLVIEEINRGNCAQIFGDLFQLLDRNNAGFSDYPIKADADMAKQLKKQLKDLTIEDPDAINSLYKGENIVSQVLDGELLLLPKNLYIWATMNTSDQSLFPIDSAFKRRWDWQYMPIANGFENWYISIEDYKFDWWQFLQKINKLIGATTHSEDKKLGYYFCKAKNKEIDANLFVSKVIFYLWNDVFKDYEFANSVFDDIDGNKLTFDKFYTTINGNAIVVEDKVVMFLNKLDEAIDKEYSMLLPNVETTTGLSGNDFTNYSFEGSAPMGKSELGKTIMLKYLNENAGLTFDEIKAKFPDSLLGSVASKGLIVKDEEDLGSYQRYYVGGFKSADGVKFKIYKQWTVGNIQNIKNFAFSQGWNVEEKGSWRRKDNNA